jgi:hypothetical protein
MKHKPIEIPPFIKKIGKKTYIVESWFDSESECDLMDKLHRLADRELSSLQSLPAEVTSTHPERFGCNGKEEL